MATASRYRSIKIVVPLAFRLPNTTCERNELSTPTTSMASCSSRRTAPRRSEVSWTREENKQFELALAHYDEDTPDRWPKVAQFVGSKSAEDVKRHYEKLVRDIDFIDAAKKPLVNYEN